MTVNIAAVSLLDLNLDARIDDVEVIQRVSLVRPGIDFDTGIDDSNANAFASALLEGAEPLPNETDLIWS